MCFRLVFALNSVHPLCIYSKQTNIASGRNIRYICYADDFFFFLWKRLTGPWMIRKENIINHCCVILRDVRMMLTFIYNI